MSISRIDPKKGLHVMLEALSQLPESVTLDIYGDGDSDYLAALHRIVEERALCRRVTFHGHVDGERKQHAFEAADLFVLPSFSENFGMAVAEALAHGLPVVVSKAAPWEGVDGRGCGWWVEPTAEAFSASIAEALTLPHGALREMGERGRTWMSREFSWDGVAAQMASVYRWAAGEGERPACVAPR